MVLYVSVNHRIIFLSYLNVGVQMSKLLDKLEKMSRGYTRSLGFGSASRIEKPAPIALLGKISGPISSKKYRKTFAEIGFDGIIVKNSNLINVSRDLAQHMGEIPWGLEAQSLDSVESGKLWGKGCDFIAFDSENITLDALTDENIGYILNIYDSMDERVLRAIEGLPIDVVLLPYKDIEENFSLSHLLQISSIRDCFSKYMLLELSIIPSTAELEALMGLGIDGIVINADSTNGKEISDLRDRIVNLPQKQRAKHKKQDGITPRAGYYIDTKQSIDSDDYDDEDDD